VRRLGITALTSINSVLRETTTFATLADVPRVVVVRHDLSQAQRSGLMRRVVSDARASWKTSPRSSSTLA